MYSSKLQSLFKAKHLRIGSRIKLTRSGKTYEGLLMPKTDAGDPDSVVIKLDSGYNIGLKFAKGMRIQKANGETPKSIKEEKKYELGKISDKLVKLKFDPRKPPISLISTGGTISSRVDYRTGGVHALEDPKEFLHNVPELAGIANLKHIRKPFSKMSEDMDYRDWQEIAVAVGRDLNSGMRGAIVTHGTDFLHYTSAALSFMLRNLHKPVILVGAQRSSDRGSSDAGMNLICAAHAAVGEIAEVGICMHGESADSFCLFNRGTKVRKLHSSRRDAFRPINDLPLARIYPNGKISILNRDHKKRSDRQKVEVDTKFEPKIAMLKAYPGSEPSVIDYLVSKGYKGFVIEASGLGHVPTLARKSWINTIKKHVKDGIPFVTASQTLYGRINSNVYTNLRILYKEAGAIPGEDMLAETAYVKLGWVLGHTKSLDKVREMMLTNYAGEITKRSLPGTFLY
jgi:glutamyl-tRNA(Gln) amidotransferase subunit D